MRVRERNNSWPSFVDLFSNLVIILIFLLIVFVFLWTTTSVFNQKTSQSAEKISELQRVTEEKADEIAELRETELEARALLIAARDELLSLDEHRMILESENAVMAREQAAMNQAQIEAIMVYERKLYNLQSDRDSMERALAEFRTREMSSQEQIARAAGLQEEIERMNNALAAADAAREHREVEYAALSERLNMAMADRVAEMAEMARYQSEFFGEVRSALSDVGGVDVSTDRFVLPSDILFPLGGFRLSADGREQIKIIADVVNKLDEKIPPHIDWVIRVDGHTDRIPVSRHSRYFRNNLELSLLRAREVVKELERHGVAARRLAPAGFGDTHPIVEGKTAAELQKNRRIELRLTNH